MLLLVLRPAGEVTVPLSTSNTGVALATTMEMSLFPDTPALGVRASVNYLVSNQAVCRRALLPKVLLKAKDDKIAWICLPCKNHSYVKIGKKNDKSAQQINLNTFLIYIFTFASQYFPQSHNIITATFGNSALCLWS